MQKTLNTLIYFGLIILGSTLPFEEAASCKMNAALFSNAESISNTSDINFQNFGQTPSNEKGLGAIQLAVGFGSSCDGITAPYTLSGAQVDSQDPVPQCFNAGLNSNVWFSFLAPLSGEVTISTDYTGGNLTNTEIALYSGTCGSLTEIACDQDGGDIVQLN